MRTFAHVDLELPAAGHASKVKLNGEDVSRFLSGIRVRSGVKEVTTVVLELPIATVGGVVDGNVVPVVVDVEAQALVDAVRAWRLGSNAVTDQTLLAAIQAYDEKERRLRQEWA